MVLEHIKDASLFHKNVLNTLNPGGKAIHFYATKYGLPSLLNSLLPDTLSDWIVYSLQKRDGNSDGKYKAYYKNTFGPTKKSYTYFKELGYNIEDYRGYLGHGYLSSMKFLFFFEKLYSKVIFKIKSPLLCSNAILVLSKQHP